MSEKKRVRVYAPQVNTDHFAQYMFEVGGPVDAPGMMQPQDTSNDVVELLQTYAQVAGLDEQQLQQMYSAIMSMEPDKQAQAIAQIQQELNSSVEANPMMAKDGGGIKAIKKLLAKKIGGVSINSNKEKETKVRSMTVANEAAKKFMENILEDTTKENLSRSMNPTMPAFDYGGYYNNPMFGMRGIRDVEDDPTYQQMLRIQNDAFSSIRDAGKALGNIGFRVDENEPIKVKRTGVARNFGNNPAQVSTDVPTQRDGGGMPSYQNAGRVYVNESYVPAFEDLNIRDEDYINAKKAYESGNFTPDQLDMINRVESYVNNLKSNPASNTGASGATGINGWYGGIYWQNGVPVTSADDMMRGLQQGMGAGTDFSQIFQSGDRRSRIQGSLMDLVRNPYAMKQFGEALDQFGYPVKKIKAGINPFGAKVKIIFDDKGNPVGQQVAGQNDGSSYGTPVQSNLANRIRSGFQSNVDEGESSGFMNKFNSAFEKMKTRRYNRKYGEPEMPSTGQSSTTSGPPVPMGRTSGSGMGSVYEPDITTPNPVYAPVQVSPRQTMESLDENQFEYGGIPKARAGKLVLKQGTDWDTASIGQALPTLMNSAANIAELSKIPSMQERIYNVGRYVPSLPSDQIGNRGTFMTGPGAGKIMPDMQNMPYAEAYYQNPVANMMGTSFELGGQYEEGGYYELDDDQLDDIFRNGGQVQYI